MTLGETIKQIRKEHKLTQVEFAKTLNTSQTHISKIEKGTDYPSAALLRVIAVTYNVDFDELNDKKATDSLQSVNIGCFEAVDFETFYSSLRSHVIGQSDYYFDDNNLDEIKGLYENIKSNLPRRCTSQSAGYDICCPFDIKISPSESVVIPLGIKSNFRAGWVLLIMPRSGLGFKYGLRLVNTVAVIDSDYEGQIMLKVCVSEDLLIRAGERIAQGIFLPFGLINDDRIDSTVNERGTGGFGSTGS